MFVTFNYRNKLYDSIISSNFSIFYNLIIKSMFYFISIIFYDFKFNIFKNYYKYGY